MLFLFTTRIRRMGEGNIFSLFTLSGGGGGTKSRSGLWGGGVPQYLGWGEPHPRGGGVPQPGLDSGGEPHPRGGTLARSGWWGYTPQVRSGWWGYPPPPGQVWMVGGYPPTHPPTKQSSKASTYYAAGGMPLAFTQEDFLVLFL